MKKLKNEEYIFGCSIGSKIILDEDILNKMSKITICPATNNREVYRFLIDKKIIDFSLTCFERIYNHGKHYANGTCDQVKHMNKPSDDDYNKEMKIRFYNLVNHLSIKTSFIARSKMIDILENSKCNKEIMEAAKYWTSNFDREAKRQYVEMDHTITKKVDQMSDEELLNIINNERDQ